MTISSLSTRDYVYISAHYWALIHGIQNDEEILARRGYSPEQLKNVKSKVHSYEIKDLLKFRVPLTRFEYSRMGYLLTLLENYEKGNLPYPGPISEQPAQIIEILNLLLALKQKAMSKQSETLDGRHDKNKSGTRR